MNESGRRIPIHILNDIIKTPISIIRDPRGTNALMHYSQIWKNGKLYNAEVLFDKTNKKIIHFKYTRKAIGPFQEIR